MWAQALSIIVGLWLMVSPSVLNSFNDITSANNRIFGPLVVTFAVVALWEAMRSARFANTIIGVWLLIACVIMGYTGTALVSNAAAAGLVIAFSVIRGEHNPFKFGGGWEALWNEEMWEKGQSEQ